MINLEKEVHMNQITGNQLVGAPTGTALDAIFDEVVPDDNDPESASPTNDVPEQEVIAA